MKHTDNELQAAIDAAMLEIGKQTIGNNFAASLKYDVSWPAEQSDRLALAKAFLAKLPEPEPILADDGLAQAIRRMEAVPVKELADAAMEPTHPYGLHGKAEAIRARLIAAARGEAVGINGLTEAEEAQTASVAGFAKSAPSTFEAHGHTWTRHTPGDPMPCDENRMVDVITQKAIAEKNWYSCPHDSSYWHWDKTTKIIGWRYADEPDSTDWKAKVEKAEANLREVRKRLEDANRGAERNAHINRSLASQLIEARKQIEKAEAELAALKSSQLGILRPINEAGPIPDGCVRVYGVYYQSEDICLLTTNKWDNDTHFADIRLPVTDTPAIEAADPHARLKAYAKAGARIRLNKGTWRIHSFFAWTDFAESYEVHPDDLHLVPEYDPVNEQPKQQVPLGPEQKLQAIKDILESK